jgi:hypothetical protein
MNGLEAVYVGGIYFIIVFVKPDVFNIDRPDLKINRCNEPVFVASNVEHVSLIAHKIRTRKCAFKVSMTAPACVAGYIIPIIQRLPSGRMLIGKRSDGSVTDYNHCDN